MDTFFYPKKGENFHLQPNKNYSSRFGQIRYKQIFDPYSFNLSKITNFLLRFSNTNSHNFLTQFDLSSFNKFIRQISYLLIRQIFIKKGGRGRIQISLEIDRSQFKTLLTRWKHISKYSQNIRNQLFNAVSRISAKAISI